MLSRYELCLATCRSLFAQGSQPAKEADETGKSFGSCLRRRCPLGLAGTGSGTLTVAISALSGCCWFCSFGSGMGSVC